MPKVHNWLSLFQWLQSNKEKAKEDCLFSEDVWLPIWRACRASLNFERDDRGAGSLSAEYRDCGKCDRELCRLAEEVGYEGWEL